MSNDDTHSHEKNKVHAGGSSKQTRLSSRLQEIVTIAALETDAKIAIITKTVAEGLLIIASYQDELNPFKIGDVIPLESNLFCLKVIANREPLHIDESGTESSHYLSTPIFNSDQSIFGALSVKESSLKRGVEEGFKTLHKLLEIIENDLSIFSS